MKKTAEKQTASMENLFQLDGRVPLGRAIPFGLQHILAMFVSNLAPILIVAAAAGVSADMQSTLLSNAMIAAGIASLIQMYPIWKIGSGLPVVMGVSFTFVSALCAVAVNKGYSYVVGCVLVGGLFEGTLGLLAKYWRKFISPITSACVVTCIGLSLFSVGANSFGGGQGAEDFGSWQNLLIGTVTLATCLIWNCKAKGYLKQLNVLVGMVVGYILSIFLGKVDLGSIWDGRILALPHLFPVKPEFDLGSIISVCVIFIVSAAETIGDTTALCNGGLNRDITAEEVQGTLAIDGYGSFISSLFGTMPVTSFSQNVGLVSMTKVVNRMTIASGCVIMILAGLCPPIANFFRSLPQAVLGGCTIMMFGSILCSGMEMISRCGFTQRNITIASLTMSISVGFTAISDMWHIFPEIIQSIFAENVVAVAFVVALLLDALLPKKMGIHEE